MGIEYLLFLEYHSWIQFPRDRDSSGFPRRIMESLQCTAFRFYSISIRRYKFHIYVNATQFHFNRDGFTIQSC